MDVLTKQQLPVTDYNCRYNTTYFYYHTKDEKYVFGTWSNIKKTAPYLAYKVKEIDTLESLALTYYNNPSLYWVIAGFNDIQDSFINLFEYYKELKIPTINAIEFGDER